MKASAPFVHGTRTKVIFLPGQLLLALGHSGHPIQDQSRSNVESHIRPHDAKVSPSGIVVCMDGREIHVRLLDFAVVAIARDAGLQEVPTRCRNMVSHVLAAILICRRIEGGEFVTCARHVYVGKTCREDGRDIVRERRGAVQEDPESGHLVRRRQDTAEEKSQNEHKVRNVSTIIGRAGE